MSRIFITGSADGLGQLAAKELINLGHQVLLHARNTERANQAFTELSGAVDVLTGDLSSIAETKALAAKANSSGRFDAVIHNAGVYRVPVNSFTEEGLTVLFAVNSLAPYILTCLIQKPKRLIYLSSGLHFQGDPDLAYLPVAANGRGRPISYSDTKLHVLILSMVMARKWVDVFSNTEDPGWVPTKMGGNNAPDNLEKGYQTQVWLAVSDEPEAKVSGRYFHHKKQARYLSAANDAGLQDKLLEACGQITGIRFEGGNF